MLLSRIYKLFQSFFGFFFFLVEDFDYSESSESAAQGRIEKL